MLGALATQGTQETQQYEAKKTRNPKVVFGY